MFHDQTRLLLIRHADSDLQWRLCGWFDAPLSHTGRAQLEALCQRPRVVRRPDALYASPLSRARAVGIALGSVWGLDPCVDPALREIHCGEFEGRRIEEVERQHPDVWARNLAQTDDGFAWPGGESYAAFRERVIGAMQRIAARHPRQRVAIVTHAGVISQVLGFIKGRRPAAWSDDRPEPLTATEVAWSDGGAPELVSFNRHEW